MEKLTTYRAILKHTVAELARCQPSHGEIEAVALCDGDHDHYQVLHLGWSQNSRVFAVILHLRLKDGKVWIERDGTAEGVANHLLAAGIPRDEIVLAFHPAWKRPDTAFAVA